MKRLLGLLLVMGMVGCGDPVAELEKLGAEIKRNEQGEVITVSCGEFTGDADLVHVKTLTKLRKLDLSLTNVTDAGLIHLKELTNLESLDLSFTEITDAGLIHLKELTIRGELDLSFTGITDAGVAELEKALPNCFIRTCQPPLPPLSRVTQPVSMNTRPVSECWRALVVWCTDVGICGGRHGGRPGRVAR